MFTESLLGLTERLIGPFNVELTIEPISIKISDAIMNFQESGFQVQKTQLYFDHNILHFYLNLLKRK